MSKRAVADFLARKDIVISFQRYAIDALAAMAQGLFASLLMGTIFTTVSDLTGIALFAEIGAFAKSVAGPAMAIAIGYALKTPPLVLFSLAAVGFAANEAGGAGGPLAVLVVAIVASEFGKAVSKETDIDILVTPATTILVGCGLSIAIASGMGTCGLVGPIGVYAGWVLDAAAGAPAPGFFDWIGLALFCFVLPGGLCWGICELMRKAGLIKDGDLKLDA